MTNADSVSVFAEGTFEEQIQELIEYLTRAKPEAERVSFRQPIEDLLITKEGQKPLADDLQRKQLVISLVVDATTGLGEGSDREIEGFYNLLFSHLLSLYTTDSSQVSEAVKKLLHILSERSSEEHAFVKYRVLANLFNAIPRTSPVRLLVCKSLLKFAAENDELDTLQLSPAIVDRWLMECGGSVDERSALLETIMDAFSMVGRPVTVFEYSLSYVRSLPPSSPKAERASLQLIALALRLPTIFNFDSLLKLENVQALSSHELFKLLHIFSRQGLAEYKAWQGKCASLMDTFQLEDARLLWKMRLLVLSELGFARIGQNLTYAEIASALQIESTDVEKWVIDIIRAGLLSGKLYQTTHTFLVVRASPRGFGAEQWSNLEQRLLAWKSGLMGIQTVLGSARQSANVGVLGSVLDQAGRTQEQMA